MVEVPLLLQARCKAAAASRDLLEALVLSVDPFGNVSDVVFATSLIDGAHGSVEHIVRGEAAARHRSGTTRARKVSGPTSKSGPVLATEMPLSRRIP
jgi:hypothetical protein